MILSGDEGRIRVNRGGLTGKPVEQLTAKDEDWINEEILKLCKGKKPGSHMGNFFDCVRQRKEPVSDVFTHHRILTSCHLCNIALLLKRKLRWDPRQEQFVGDDQANALLSRPHREGYAFS